jgi:2-polyprenyl-6-methoxyphenol hydroxylase-like FAD-dependent oxidoreductase
LCDRAFVGRSGVIRRTDGRALVSTSLPDFGNGLDHFVALRRSHLFTELGLFGSAPVGDGTYMFCDAGSPGVRAALERSDLGSLLDAWSRVFPDGRALLELVPTFDDLLVNDVVTVQCEQFHAGSSALIGDAAHAMAPNTGQGANSALVDAAVLLASVQEADDVPGALHAYTRRRHRKVSYVQRLSGRLARFAAIRSRSGRRTRDLAVRATAPVTGSRRQIERLMQEPPSWLFDVASQGTESR